MEKAYKHITWLFVVILLLVPIGFRRYFGLFPAVNQIAWQVHFHTICMGVWCVLLVIQPLLIRWKKRKWHRLLGMLSYMLVPTIIYSILLVIAYSYKRMAPHLSLEDNRAQVFTPISQMILFGFFYSLAMYHRKMAGLHMRYIIVSSIALLGPTIGRINFTSLGLQHVDMDLIIMEVVLIMLLIVEGKNRKVYLPYIVGLVAYTLMHLGYYYFTHTYIWQQFIGMFFRGG